MNTLQEIHPEAQTATSAILTDLSDGHSRSAKQIYERSEVLESRQDANKFLWYLRQRGMVVSVPAIGDIGDPSARLVWSITAAGRAYLAGTTIAGESAPEDKACLTETPPAANIRQAKPKAKDKPAAVPPVPAAPAPEAHDCLCSGACSGAAVQPSGAKYLRDINLVDGKADVYAVLVAFNVICPARQHAIKKLLCAGLRGKGDEAQDLAEARDAMDRAIQMQLER